MKIIILVAAILVLLRGIPMGSISDKIKKVSEEQDEHNHTDYNRA